MLLYYDEFSKRRVSGHLLKLTYLVGRSSNNLTGEQVVGFYLFLSIFSPRVATFAVKIN